jgi:wyosine [tRNA(Phe)-imidazoG37] synthetase (radical SAM superfamily)
MNRPHKNLRLSMILKGIEEFTEVFGGKITIETMLINNVKYDDEFEKIAKFLAKMEGVDKVYIAVPTRPPAEKWVKPAKEETLNRAFQIFSREIGSDKVEYLIGYEGDTFTLTGNVKNDLLSITAVHPMHKEAIIELLKKAGADWHAVEELLQRGELIEIEYEGEKYYIRKFRG